MPDYEKMYFQLAAKVADAVEILVKAQQQGENDYIEDEALIISITDREPKTKGDN